MERCRIYVCYAIILCLASAFGSAAFACSIRQMEPPRVTDAYDAAEAVFLGEVVAMNDSISADFKPADPAEYAARLSVTTGQDKQSVGRLISLKPITVWKGDVPAKRVDALMLYGRNTCEWDYDIQPGDHYLIFAARYGNYLAFSGSVGGMGIYTAHDPSERPATDYSAEQQKQFDHVVAELNAIKR